jgi:IS1 family transposase
LTLQCDELWSFVGKRSHKVWVWLAMDADTREVVAVHIGDRSRDSAKALWAKVPSVYRQCAMCFTDDWEAYVGVLPHQRHRIVAKGSGKTSYIERFNNTLRQRLARLTRETLAFSKKLANHIGAIWFFIHHYNAALNAG